MARGGTVQGWTLRLFYLILAEFCFSCRQGGAGKQAEQNEKQNERQNEKQRLWAPGLDLNGVFRIRFVFLFPSLCLRFAFAAERHRNENGP